MSRGRQYFGGAFGPCPSGLLGSPGVSWWSLCFLDGFPRFLVWSHRGLLAVVVVLVIVVLVVLVILWVVGIPWSPWTLAPESM